jgi:undecaprenyl-diphosphatase
MMYEQIWYFISITGEPLLWAVSAVFLVALYFFTRRFGKRNELLRRFLVIFIPSILLVFGLTVFLKMAVATPRPCTPCIISAENCNPYCSVDYAFPSGHAATIFTVFVSLYLAVRHRKRMMLLPYIILPFFVSLSRIVLGVHTPTDVLVGTIMGLFVPWFFWKYGNDLRNNLFKGLKFSRR